MPSGSERRLGPLGLSLALTLTAYALPRVACAQDHEVDAYPADITPPSGTRYPCALSPLPRGLPGIPESDRAYINRSYARILRATQAKLVLLHTLEDPPKDALAAALGRYREAVRALEGRERADVPPDGLGPFQADLLTALGLHRSFFDKAVAARGDGASMTAVYDIPEGRQASARLIAAWGRMQARYPGWSAETRDSVYHHLCALDLF